MVILRRSAKARLLPAHGTILVGRIVRVRIRVQTGNTRRRWTKGIKTRNFIARHPAKTLESRDDWIANLQSYVRDDYSTDVLVTEPPGESRRSSRKESMETGGGEDDVGGVRYYYHIEESVKILPSYPDGPSRAAGK